jgi:hypothetical protein
MVELRSPIQTCLRFDPKLEWDHQLGLLGPTLEWDLKLGLLGPTLERGQ